MELGQLLRAVDIECGFDSLDINKVTGNSERVEKGDLFVCIKGRNHDGHDYVDKAVERGAAAIIAEREIPTSVPLFISKNTRRLMPRLCDAAYGYPSAKLKMVAVTGTNGKTSVTHMLKSIFEAAMYKTGIIGTIGVWSGDRKLDIASPEKNANMTTPDPEELFLALKQMADDRVEYVFLEASSHALALDKLCGIELAAAVFTNLTPEHLDFHNDMEDYFRQKSKLFEMAQKKIINLDDPYGKRLKSMYPDAFGCSLKRKCCDFHAEDLKSLGVNGNEYRFVSSERHFLVRSPLLGDFNVMNTLQAAACASALGVSPSYISSALSVMRGVKGRLERVKLGEIRDYSVFIDYAHTPDALENLLVTVNDIKDCNQRLVLLFGCGGDRDKSKRRKMGEIAVKYADLAIVTSDNSRSEEPSEIISEIVSGMSGGEYAVIESRAEAIEYAIKNACKGDVIILAGKGHEEYEIDKSGKHYFDERAIVLNAAEKYNIKN